jgi:hypothetical protein
MCVRVRGPGVGKTCLLRRLWRYVQQGLPEAVLTLIMVLIVQALMRTTLFPVRSDLFDPSTPATIGEWEV